MRGEGFGAMIILTINVSWTILHECSTRYDGRSLFSGGPGVAARLEREGYIKISWELGWLQGDQPIRSYLLRRSKWLKKLLNFFSEMHAEPSWLADLRQAFDKIEFRITSYWAC